MSGRAAHGVRGAFAIFRDGAVYEFGGSPPMETAPEEFIAGIGGSTGVASAAKAVQAVVRLGAMAKASKAAMELLATSTPLTTTQRIPSDVR